MQILVVDDKESLRQLVAAHVEDNHHTVIGAENGLEALEIFSKHPIDLILMDVEMPGMDGFETTKRFRALSKKHWIPIIFLSGMTSDSHYQKGIEAGGDDYLTKPVRPVILKAKLMAMERIIKIRDDLQHANETLEQINLTDPLTQIPNRRGFDEFAARIWGDSSRKQTPVCIIMIDIDHFKLYNDNYGHIEGDNCLKKVSHALAQSIQRPCDMVARFGGEEFIAILPDTRLEGGKILAEKMRDNIEKLGITHKHSPLNEVITISIGVSSCLNPRNTAITDLIASADKSLYKSKKLGRNRVEGKDISINKQVLIVDDDSYTLRLIQEMLADNYEVTTANSGDDCLQQLDECLPDLILSDINMPKMNGLKLCRSLKDNERTQSIPFLFMSTEAKENYIQDIKKAGGSGFISKPLDETLLHRKLQNFLL